MVTETTQQAEVHPIRTCEEILAEAQKVWSRSKEQHRNACVRMGELLHEYLIASLREGDNLPIAVRAENGITRQRIIWRAADHLGMRPPQANMMIAVAQMVGLLGEPGQLSYAVLREFTVFVRRKRARVARGRQPKEDEILLSESNEWEIKPAVGYDPRELYAKAVAEEWTLEKALEEIAVIKRNNTKPKSRLSKKVDTRLREKKGGADLCDNEEACEDGIDRTSSNRLPRLSTIASTTDPRDLADMILEMIRACPRTDELKKILMERIR